MSFKIFYRITPSEVQNKLEELKGLSLRDPDHLPPAALKDAGWHGQQCKDFYDMHPTENCIV